MLGGKQINRVMKMYKTDPVSGIGPVLASSCTVLKAQAGALCAKICTFPTSSANR